MMDFTDHMTSLTDIDGSVFAYEFDGEGNRRSQSLNDCLSKRFVYDGADVLLELNPTNGVAYAWINGPGIDQPIERLLFIDGSPRARRVFHADALGSVAALTAPDGLLTDTYAYTAFGSLRFSTGHDPNRVTYTAREQLGDSQRWTYYRHRVYLPGLGRFASMDPLGFYDGANTWAYCGNNPLLLSDPLGEWGRWFGHGDNYVLGRDHTFLSPGGPVAKYIEDYLPAAHTFALHHDDWIDWIAPKGTWRETWLDPFVNVPSMPFFYAFSVGEETIASACKLAMATGRVANWTAKKAYSGAIWTGKMAYSGIVGAGRGIYTGAVWTGRGIYNSTRAVGRWVWSGFTFIGGLFSSENEYSTGGDPCGVCD